MTTQGKQMYSADAKADTQGLPSRLLRYSASVGVASVLCLRGREREKQKEMTGMRGIRLRDRLEKESQAAEPFSGER